MTIEHIQLRPTIAKSPIFCMCDANHVLFWVHHTDHINRCTCGSMYSSSSMCGFFFFIGTRYYYAQPCKTFVHQGLTGVGNICWHALTALMFWTYCCTAFVVGLCAHPTVDALNVAGGVLLACCWSWHTCCCGAILHWLACCHKALNSVQLWTYFRRYTVTME